MNKKLNSRLAPEDFVLVQLDEDLFDDSFVGQPVSYFGDALIRLSRNKSAIIAFGIIVFIIIMALFGPAMNQFGYNQQMVDRVNLPPRIPIFAKFGVFDGTRILYNRQVANLTDPSRYPEGSILETVRTFTSRDIAMADIKADMYKMHDVPDDINFWFGTDYLGRDLWTRTWRGARVSLMIAVIAVFVNIVIGTIYGAIAGYYGGKADMVMMRFTEIVGAFPQSILATMLILVLGTGIRAIIIALVVRGWIGTARLIRAQFLRFKGREYVLAARTLGVDDRKLIFRHILPNSIGPIITRAMIAVPGAIFSEAFLAFIGLGIQAPEPSMGVLLSDAQKVLTSYPYQTLFPAILISILMISFNLFGNGLRDAFDPTMRGID